MGTGKDEVKRENAQPETVYTTAGGTSLVLLTDDLRNDGS